MLLLLISFVAGILTILAPCVLPLLPVIIGGSLSGNARQKSRPYIIAGALAGSIILFTLLLKVSTILINLSPNTLTDASGALIIALGLVSVFPELWEKLIISLNWQATSQRFLGKGEQNRGRFLGPILIGVALGPVFSSCSPTYAFILASVLPKEFISGLLYLIAYSIGLVVTLLVVSLAGRRYISRFSWAIDTHSVFRRVIGIIFIVIGAVIITGHAVPVETWIANRLPFDETRIEQLLLATQHQGIAPSIKTSGTSVLNVQSTPEPQLQGLTNWMNSKPLQLSQLHGKVVLVDFWTYSCVNCNRALPYVEKWYNAYKGKGLVIIGVHTPEFAFEHNPVNVANAVRDDGITYPVALDNNYDTWNAFDNDSWPADYLIDKSGNIRYVSLGEGNYNVTEEAIQQLLGIHQPLQTPTSNVPVSQNQTPETYFGTNRESDNVDTPAITNDGTYDFTAAPAVQLPQNDWTIGGSWNIGAESITSQSNSDTLTFSVEAKDVYIVAGAPDEKSEGVTVGLPANVSGQYGINAPGGLAAVGSPGLYHIVSLHSFGTTVVTLQVPQGVSLYTFTFGS
jgi:cytochrome c biogenesis protein CcdA/thiol-disulfide isomerase/thioredoxin